jgi:hypothetical protein
MTLLEMVNAAVLEAGFSRYTQLFSSTNTEARQLTALANRELNTLKKDDWNELVKTHVIPMTASNDYPLPSDFRNFTADTAWTNTRRFEFPADKSMWYYFKASGVDTGIRPRMRIIDNALAIDNPDPGQDGYIEYISDSPVLSSLSVPKPKFSSDDDTLILNDELFVMGVKWRFEKVKGLDWQADFQEYQKMYRSERGTNQGASTIRTGGGYDDNYLTEPNANLWVGGTP